MIRILIAFVWITLFQQAEAQSDSLPVYQRFPVLPIFNIMTVPDGIKFTKDDLEKKKATIFMLFSPDCEHCKHTTKDLLDHMDLFKKAQIIMVSSLDFIHIKNFYEEFKISDYPNITMGRDATYYLGTFYEVRNFPSIFVYDKKGNFIKAFEGSFKMETIAESL